MVSIKQAKALRRVKQHCYGLIRGKRRRAKIKVLHKYRTMSLNCNLSDQIEKSVELQDLWYAIVTTGHYRDTPF